MKGAEPLIQVKNIDHVTLVVKDLNQSREFYIGLLGMREVPRPAFGFPGCWFQAGNTQIHLNLEGEEAGPAGNVIPENRVKTRTHHIAFLVEDAAEAGRKLEERGIPLIQGPRPRPDGAVQVFLHDPDGHVIEISSSPA